MYLCSGVNYSAAGHEFNVNESVNQQHMLNKVSLNRTHIK